MVPYMSLSYSIIWDTGACKSRYLTRSLVAPCNEHLSPPTVLPQNNFVIHSLLQTPTVEMKAPTFGSFHTKKMNLDVLPVIGGITGRGYST